MAALRELAANYGASVALCTATRPALRAKNGFDEKRGGFPIGEERELAPDPPALYSALKRIRVILGA
jgi:CRISPR-associated endonuclease/helicase Cas3